MVKPSYLNALDLLLKQIEQAIAGKDLVALDTLSKAYQRISNTPTLKD